MGERLVDRLEETFGTDAGTVAVRLRELLTMALCHSKSAMPTEAMEDQQHLRAAMTVAVLADIEAQFQAWGTGHWTEASPATSSGHEVHYERAQLTPFAWLDSSDPAEHVLRDDVLDTVRILRVADALRQRGTDLRTSAGFEVFVDDTGQAVFHLASAEGDVAVQLRLDSPLSVGEANITSAMLERNGDLRVVLHRGEFPAAARDRVASACARVVVDIALDVLDVFRLAPAAVIQLERCLDDPDFAVEVQRHISEQSALGSRTVVVTSLARSDDIERTRYAQATPVVWPSSRADEIWAGLHSTGFRTEEVDASRCFSDARIATLARGDIVIDEGQPGTFVYIPLDSGLELQPGAGFAPQSLTPWRHLGATAVLRRGVRNSTIAAITNLDVLMIPGDVYSDAWFRPYEIGDVDAIRGLMAKLDS